MTNAYSQQRQREKKANIYPVLLAMQAELYRQNGDEVDWNWGQGRYDKIVSEPENLSFLSLPRPDRIFTKAKDYTSGNYKYLPGTHIMSASGCWHGKCIYCVEREQNYEVREVDDVVEEIRECQDLGFKEVFDDSATFPTGKWLEDFCRKIKPLNIRWSCNMRICDVDFSMMRSAGCRMVLFGIESVNQYTLDKIQKGVRVEDISPTIIKASKCGLDPHIAVMFGTHGETHEDAKRTIKFVHKMLRNGYAKTAQASLYKVTGNEDNEAFRPYVKKIYQAAYYPDFWFNKIRDIKTIEDITYIWKGIQSWLM